MHAVALIAQLATCQKADFAMRLGIFKRIRQNIIQNLLQALQIAAHHFIFLQHQLRVKELLLQLGLRRKNIVGILRYLGNHKGFLHMLHLAVVQARHFQDIVNQGQQLLPCSTYFADIFLHLSAVILVQLCQLRHADNAVKRRTHIMRQCGEEHISRFGIFTCHLQRLLRQLQMLQLLLLFSFYLTEEENCFVLIQQIIAHQADIQPSVFLPEAIAELTAEVIDMTLHQILDMLTRKAGRKFFSSLRLHILYQLLQQLIIIALRLLRSWRGTFQHIIASCNIINSEHSQE